MTTLNFELSELILNKETHQIVRKKALVIALKNADIKHACKKSKVKSLITLNFQLFDRETKIA